MKSSVDERTQTKIAGAVACGMALAVGFTAPVSSPTFSLINIGNWFRESGGLSILRLLVILSFFFLNHRRILFFIAAAFLVITSATTFSLTGAFYVPLILSALFCFFTLHAERPQRKAAATVMLALTFLLAAIQKLNEPYLRGDEFGPFGAFLVYLLIWNVPPLPSGLQTVLPVLSILLEFSIFAGLIWRPVIFSHVAMIFVSALAIVHPPVLFVYGMFVTYVILIDEKWAKTIGQTRPAEILRQPFFWTVATIYMITKTADFSVAGLRLIPIAAALTIYHSWILIRRFRESEPALQIRPIFQNSRLSIAPALTIFTVAAFYAGAPAPIGFSMFSGRSINTDIHTVRIEDANLCRTISQEWRFLVVVDAGIVSNDDKSCNVFFPTRSGLDGITKRLCSIDPNAVWTRRHRGERTYATENCSSRGDEK